MGKITFPRPALLKNHEFSRCFRTNKNSLRQPPYRRNYLQNHTSESGAEFLRGGAILRPNRSVVEKRDVIEIVEITPSRQTVIIQDPARHERIQRTHLENRRALQRQCFVGQDHFARYRQPFETLQKALIELRRLHDYAQVVEIKTTAALEPFFPGLFERAVMQKMDLYIGQRAVSFQHTDGIATRPLVRIGTFAQFRLRIIAQIRHIVDKIPAGFEEQIDRRGIETQPQVVRHNTAHTIQRKDRRGEIGQSPHQPFAVKRMPHRDYLFTPPGCYTR